MKTILPSFLCLICTIAFNNTNAQTPYNTGMPVASNNTSNQHGQKAGVDHIWYEQAVQNIEVSERQIFKNNTPGHYHTVNTKKREGFIITPAAFSVYPLNVAGNDSLWNVRLSIAGIEKGNSFLKPVGKYNVEHKDNWIRYLFKDFDVEYINGDAGLRQNFIVKQKPAGTASLKVHIKLSGSLAARITTTNAVQFFDRQDGVNRLMYDDLKVWDANHQPVAANMSLENEGTSLVIEAADQQAVYPLTIDPITSTPEWTSSASGLLASLSSVDINSALYGYVVTSLGDVNGDGLGDVAISAPTVANIFAGNGSLANVGAVFVFYGTSNGLATTPAQILQPNTAVAGALFGLSVDAGDVTGDGINDIIVGAPLDKTSITVGVLNFNGTVGKVYVYPGGSLVSNPTNFLTLQLSTAYEGLTNLSVNALFGFSVSATEDMNGDGKKDILVGSPLYASIASPGVQTGGAFLFLSNAGNTFSTIQSLQPPAFSLLGINLPLLSGINGLLFGYSVDGLGDYNGDGINDIIVGAPAGVNLSSLTGILNGQVLGGSAYVYYGAASNAGTNTTTGATLQAASGGLLGNAANLFGFKVKGLRSIKGARTGGAAVGSPVAGLIPNTLSLTIKSGTVSIFNKQSASPAAVVIPNQTLETPRSSSILQVLNTMSVNDLFGAAIDNAYDVNCDGYADLVVGSPLSSGTNLPQLKVNGLGGSVYVYYGTASGAFQTTPGTTVSASYGSDFLSLNAIAMFGFSVATANNMYGAHTTPRIIAGAPAAALDFNGVLNLGSTIGTLFSFAATDNGPGKANIFSFSSCNVLTTLPVSLVSFTGNAVSKSVLLEWTSVNELNLNQYEVERNSNNAGFTTIGMVFPNENASSSTYPFKDASPAIGYSLYRLKMIDKDGNYKYSNTISVQFTLQTNGSIKIFPNPVGSTLNLSLTGITNGNYHFKVIDALGQVLLEQSLTVSQQNQILNINRPGSMRPGMYWISLLDAKGQQIQKAPFIAQ